MSLYRILVGFRWLNWSSLAQNFRPYSLRSSSSGDCHGDILHKPSFVTSHQGMCYWYWKARWFLRIRFSPRSWRYSVSRHTPKCPGNLLLQKLGLFDVFLFVIINSVPFWLRFPLIFLPRLASENIKTHSNMNVP